MPRVAGPEETTKGGTLASIPNPDSYTQRIELREADAFEREHQTDSTVPSDAREAVPGTGAYCRSMASNYNTRPRAAEVMVSGDRAWLIREREAVADLFRAEHLLPEDVRTGWPLRLLKESRFNHLSKLAFRHVYWNALLPGRPLGLPSAMSMAGKHPAGPQTALSAATRPSTREE